MINVLYLEKGDVKGGAALSLRILLEVLDRSKYQPFIALTASYAKSLDFPIENIEVLKLPERKFGGDVKRHNPFVYFLLSVAYFFAVVLPGAARLGNIIRRKKIHIVHLNNDIAAHYSGILAAKILHIPIVCHLRMTRPLTIGEKIFSKLIDRFVALSRSGRDYFICEGLQEEKVIAIYDPYKIDGFQSLKDTQFSWVRTAQRKKRVGICSRLVPGKGHEVFLEAVKEISQVMSEVHFFIMGEDDKENRGYKMMLEKKMMDLGLQSYVTFTGWQHDIMSALAQLDIIVDVSNYYPEGLRRTLIEAMLAEKAVIATDIGQTREVIEDSGAGFLISCNSSKELSEKIIYLLQHDDLRKEMGKRGRKYASEKYDRRLKAKETEALYQSLVKARGE